MSHRRASPPGPCPVAWRTRSGPATQPPHGATLSMQSASGTTCTKPQPQVQTFMIRKCQKNPIHRSHSISFTRAQGIPKYKIGGGGGNDGRVGERLALCLSEAHGCMKTTSRTLNRGFQRSATWGVMPEANIIVIRDSTNHDPATVSPCPSSTVYTVPLACRSSYGTPLS
jgi:hypothetical protein